MGQTVDHLIHMHLMNDLDSDVDKLKLRSCHILFPVINNEMIDRPRRARG